MPEATPVQPLDALGPLCQLVAQAWMAQAVPAVQALGFTVRELKPVEPTPLSRVARCSLASAGNKGRAHVEFHVSVSSRVLHPRSVPNFEAYFQVSLLASQKHMFSVSSNLELGASPQSLETWASAMLADLLSAGSMLAPQPLAQLIDSELSS